MATVAEVAWVGVPRSTIATTATAPTPTAAAAAAATTTTTTGLALAPAPAAQAPADRARRADLGPPGLLPALALPRGARSDTHTRNLTQRISQIAVYK